MKVANIIAGVAVGVVIIGALTGLVVNPIKQDIMDLKTALIDHEVRLKASEISEARTGVNLSNLTKSIERLINKMESFAPTGTELVGKQTNAL